MIPDFLFQIKEQLIVGILPDPKLFLALKPVILRNVIVGDNYVREKPKTDPQALTSKTSKISAA